MELGGPHPSWYFGEAESSQRLCGRGGETEIPGRAGAFPRRRSMEEGTDADLPVQILLYS
ncbi:hypothetical protein D3C76_1698980 [compost metagenome]